MLEAATAAKAAGMRLFTVGHSNRDLDAFLGLLETHGIATLVDVRRFPRSRRWPHFDRNRIEAALAIEYVWLGEELGGYRDDGYEQHMKSESFAAGVAALLELPCPVACMCAEKDWQHCHRRFIASHFVDAGHEVLHIIDNAPPRPHTQQLDLF